MYLVFSLEGHQLPASFPTTASFLLQVHQHLTTAHGRPALGLGLTLVQLALEYNVTVCVCVCVCV